ncbi:MAG: helix-turn-helix domain-containing protein [Clostridia bacterium]|nr:helix-turn-helix domain-containing protein [Clostridia bacterium]
MKNEYASSANKRIADARKNAGLTQQQAAEKLNMKRNTYARMERLGNPDIKTLQSLTELFGVSADWLLCKEENDIGFTQNDTASQMLNETNDPFNSSLPFMPNQTEINFIKVFHVLKSKENKDAALKFINDLYKKEIEEKTKK